MVKKNEGNIGTTTTTTSNVEVNEKRFVNILLYTDYILYVRVLAIGSPVWISSEPVRKTRTGSGIRVRFGPGLSDDSWVRSGLFIFIIFFFKF